MRDASPFLTNDRIRVFLCHSEADAYLALQLRAQLEDASRQMIARSADDGRRFVPLECWNYEHHSRFGHDIDRQVELAIRNCDVFMLVVPEHNTLWVRRELGLAAHVRRTSKVDHPQFICVVPSPEREQLLASIIPVDFDTQDEIGALPANVFGRYLRPYRSATDPIETFVTSLTAPFCVYGRDARPPEDIPGEAWTCYKNLFRIERERDNPSSIRDWLDKSCTSLEAPWIELFFTMQFERTREDPRHRRRTTCIAMAYLSLYPSSNWAFGNYFGVLQEWRSDNRAKRFADYIQAECIHRAGVAGRRMRHGRPDANVHGIVFEVDRFSPRAISSAVEKLKAEAPTPLTRRELNSIRFLKRIKLYQGSGCLTLVGRNGKPVDYIQPAMDEPLTSKNEEPLWVMVYPFQALYDALQSPDFDARNILDFLFDDVFPSGYDPDDASQYASKTGLAGYKEYSLTVKQRVLATCGNEPLRLIRGKNLHKRSKDLLSEVTQEINELGIRL